jgi:hypothetical protein
MTLEINGSDIMSKMRNIVIVETKKFIESENNLLGVEWKANYFAPTDEKAIHVSEVKYTELEEDDMLRFLMYLLLERDGAIDSRIRNTNNSI